MGTRDIIQEILKDSNYHLNLFSSDEINELQDRIFFKTARKKETAHIKCIIRDKDIVLKPEEVVRLKWSNLSRQNNRLFKVETKSCSNGAQGVARSGITARAVTSTPHQFSYFYY